MAILDRKHLRFLTGGRRIPTCQSPSVALRAAYKGDYQWQ